MPQPLRVLLVDDDIADRLICRRTLGRFDDLDVELLEAGSAEEGRRRIVEEQPDCVLLDYSLGPTSGLELLAQLRQDGVDVPVIMLTGYQRDELERQAGDLGVIDFIDKGAMTRDLLQRHIRSAVGVAA